MSTSTVTPRAKLASNDSTPVGHYWPPQNIRDKLTAGRASKPKSAKKPRQYTIDDGPALDSPIITLHVGPFLPSSAIHIHASVLPLSSSVLSAALKHRKSDTLTLLDYNRTAFTIYAKWLYTRRIGLTHASDTPGTDDPWLRWEACYILSATLLDTHFGDALLDIGTHMVKDAKRVPLTVGITIYQHSKKGSKHRRWAVGAMVFGVKPVEWAVLVEEEHGEEFLRDLVVCREEARRGEGAMMGFVEEGV